VAEKKFPKPALPDKKLEGGELKKSHESHEGKKLQSLKLKEGESRKENRLQRSGLGEGGGEVWMEKRISPGESF